MRNKGSRRLAIVMLAVIQLGIASVSAQPNNLLINGSFESPGGLSEHSSLLIPAGSTNLTGWTIGGSGGPISYANSTIGELNFSPIDGSYHITFNGGDLPSGTFISQSIATELGADYRLSLYVSRIGGGQGEISLTVTISDSSNAKIAEKKIVATEHGYGPQEVIDFTAVSTNSTVKITDTSVEVHGVDVGLDAVQLVKIAPRFDLERLKFSPIAGFRFGVVPPSKAAKVSIESSLDFVNWNSLFTFNSSGTAVEFIDPSTTNSNHRFYRVMLK